VCGTLLFVTCYLLTLNILYHSDEEQDCLFEITGIWTEALNNLSQSIKYVWWFFPVIYVFWPKGRCCCCCRKNEDIASRTDDIQDAFNEIAAERIMTGSYKNLKSTVEVDILPKIDDLRVHSMAINEDEERDSF
jgi:hypothetical protein